MPELSTTLDYYHPLATLLWQHREEAGDDWQDAELLSGYVSGQGGKTLTLDGAIYEETGFIRCAITNPHGGVEYSDLVTLVGVLPDPLEFVGPEPTNRSILVTPPGLEFVGPEPLDQEIIAS